MAYCSKSLLVSINVYLINISKREIPFYSELNLNNKTKVVYKIAEICIQLINIKIEIVRFELKVFSKEILIIRGFVNCILLVYFKSNYQFF